MDSFWTVIQDGDLLASATCCLPRSPGTSRKILLYNWTPSFHIYRNPWNHRFKSPPHIKHITSASLLSRSSSPHASDSFMTFWTLIYIYIYILHVKVPKLRLLRLLSYLRTANSLVLQTYLHRLVTKTNTVTNPSTRTSRSRIFRWASTRVIFFPAVLLYLLYPPCLWSSCIPVSVQ